jgi:hypothetical protein
MSANASPEAETLRFLRTGDHDDLFPAWPGNDMLERARLGDGALRNALIAEVARRTRHATEPAELADLDVVAFTRTKVGPMVRGLFSRREQEAVLEVLSRAVVFLSPANILTVLQEEQWLNTAWDLANLYLGSFGAELLGPDAPELLGLAEETRCYVSVEYLRPSHDRFADFIVHEAAHVFHNCKRQTMGLPYTRRREWPIELAFGKRETFAYSCEAYSRLLELGRTPTERLRLLDDLARGPIPGHASVDHAEYLDILREAAAARNGWKRILARCAPPAMTGGRRRADQAGQSAEPTPGSGL